MDGWTDLLLDGRHCVEGGHSHGCKGCWRNLEEKEKDQKTKVTCLFGGKPKTTSTVSMKRLLRNFQRLLGS